MSEDKQDQTSYFSKGQISQPVPIFGNLERKWLKIEEDLEKVLNIIKEDQLLEDLNLKTLPNIKIQFLKVTEDEIFYFKSSQKVLIYESKEIVLFKKKKNSYIELIFELVAIEDKVFACKPKLVRTSEYARKSERIPILNQEIYASSFQVANINLNISDYLEEAENQFLEIERDYKFTHPKIQFCYLYKKEKIHLEELIVLEEKKAIFIQNASEVKSYPGNYVDLEKIYRQKEILEIKKQEFKTLNLSSFLYYPIFFRLKDKEIFVGVVYLKENYPNIVPTSDIYLMEEIETRFKQSLLKEFNETIKEKTPIVNVSQDGILFRISSYKVIEAIIERNFFSSEIYLRGEKLKLNLEAKNIYKIENYFFVGCEILGNINRDSNLKKYLEFIENQYGT
jgi:hypothetical protein